jgi:hypothetical protein
MKSILLTIFVCILSVQISNTQWQIDSSGFNSPHIVYSLTSNGNYILTGTDGYAGVYFSSNNGGNWIRGNLSAVWAVNSLASNGSIFAGTYNSIPPSGVWKSIDNGTSWSLTLLNNATIASLAVNGNNIFAGTVSTGVYLSTNNGLSWAQTSLNNQNVPSLAVNGNNVFAGTTGNGLYKSTNSGTNWTQTSLNNQNVYSLAVNGNNVFAGCGNNVGLYFSTDNGSSWNGPTLTNVLKIGSLLVNGNYLFAGTTDGVYVSPDFGADWVQKNEGLGNLTVNALCILNNYIFAATNNCVYRRPLGELTGIKPISEQIPEHYGLQQNYPNPFNPSTNIKFEIPNISPPFTKGGQGGLTTLKIFDLLGREVATLVNERLKPGTYEVEFNGSGYSSGIYFYKLVTEDFIDSKKMILIK